MEEELQLDDFVVKNGEEFDNTKFKTKSTEEVLDLKQLAYKDDNPMTSNIQFPTSDDVAMSAEEAEKHAIFENAKYKLEKENEAFQKLSDDEKIKEYILQSQFYKAANDYYHKYGFEMSGTQKRTIRRKIDLAYKKGKYKLSDQERIDILTSLANAGNNSRNQPQQVKQTNQMDQIASLTSLTYKG